MHRFARPHGRRPRRSIGALTKSTRISKARRKEDHSYKRFVSSNTSGSALAFSFPSFALRPATFVPRISSSSKMNARVLTHSRLEISFLGKLRIRSVQRYACTFLLARPRSHRSVFTLRRERRWLFRNIQRRTVPFTRKTKSRKKYDVNGEINTLESFDDSRISLKNAFLIRLSRTAYSNFLSFPRRNGYSKSTLVYRRFSFKFSKIPTDGGRTCTVKGPSKRSRQSAILRTVEAPTEAR